MTITDAPDAPGLDRRRALRLLGGAAASAVALAATSTTAAHADVVEAVPSPPDPVLRAPLPPGPDFDRHLLLRTTYGLTPQLTADVAAAGGGLAWLERQLAPAAIDDSACDRVVQRFPLAHASPPEVQGLLSFGKWDAMYDLVRMTAARQIWSQRQVFETMAEFWANHLSMPANVTQLWSSRGSFDRVLRQHALGRFEDMLVAATTSPAMLTYLNADSSKKFAPNENLGRELLELHSLGVDGGYAQRDVVDAARALTGITVQRSALGVPASAVGLMRYEPKWHWTGPLRVLGWTHTNADPNGLPVAVSLIRYLANHPATARRIARKLVVRFVSDDPPAALVERLAQVYLQNGTAVVPVLRALFSSPEFAGSAGLKYRRPWEDAIATARAVGVQASADLEDGDLATLVWQAGQAGHAPMGWGPPNGYPDVAAAWAGSGSVLARWNIHTQLARGSYGRGGFVFPGTLVGRLLPGPLPTTRAALVRALWDRLLPGTPLTTAHSDALVGFLGGPGPVKPADTSVPTFPLLVSVLMSSPHWSAR